MIQILALNLHAERLSRFGEYLTSIRMMLPYLAASVHRSYTKSVYWFLNEMEALDPVMRQSFDNGQFVVRRSDNAYAGISPDLAVEQVLMAGIKGTKLTFFFIFY